VIYPVDKEPLSKWFGLKRSNYVLDPRANEEDALFYARRTSVDINKQITDLEISLGANLAPKKLYWGTSGGGKTHTIYKLLYELGDRLPIIPVLVDCPNMTKSSTFVVLFQETMKKLKMDFVISLLRDALNDAIKDVGIGNPELAEKKLCEIMENEDLGRATYCLTQTRFDVMTLWKWVSAAGTTSRERSELRVTSDLLDADPRSLAQILLTFGKLVKKYKKKSLVMAFDELDRAKGLNVDAAGTFSTAFTVLTDPTASDISVFLSTSAERQRDVPAMITKPVLTRLGESIGGIIEIPVMTPQEVEPFVKDLIKYVRDPGINIKKLIDLAKTETSEQILEDLYPFTKEAIESIKLKVGKEIIPRHICMVMSRASSYAKQIEKMHVVTSKSVENS